MEPKIDFIKKCDFCDSYAKILCYECLNYYCDACYKFIHDKEKNSNHKKEQIDPFIPIDLKCQIHTKIPLNLFCLEEKGNTIIISNFLFIFIFRTLLRVLFIQKFASKS